MSVHNNLKSLRVHNNYKQTHVAGVINRSQQTYSKYERGLCPVPRKLLAKLAAFYGVTVEQIHSTLPAHTPALPAGGLVETVLQKVTVFMEVQQQREEKILLLLEAALKSKKPAA